MKPLPTSLCAASITLPALSAREAEALIDLLEQIMGVLWDTYGDAILFQHAPDDGTPGPDDDDLPS